MQRNSKPLTWRPRGLSDGLDGSDVFSGAMLSLQNLIPDPTTRGLWQCRPASIKLIDLNNDNAGPFSSGFSSGFQHAGGSARGFVSVYKILGTFLYAMVASAKNPGHDEPICVNLLTNTEVPVTGTITATTTPVSPPTINAWQPPQMDIIGVKLMVAHSGFTGAGGNFVGWFDLTTPSAPVWNAGNLTGLVQFTVAPTGVKQFFNRAYSIHNAPGAPAVIFSDPLNATNTTNANQVLTFGDNVALTALGALPLSNQLGGIIQSVMVFKGVTNIYQITGDAALTTTDPLSVNSLNVATGTFAPNTITATPKGLTFMAPDGLRLIDFNAQVSDPIGLDGSGVTVPFIFSTVPTRMAAACNGSLLRITTQNGNISSTPTLEYWYDFGRQIWSGPHTFPASLISAYNQTFIMTPTGIFASFWQSDSVQSLTSTFVENGAQMTYTAQTCLLPDTDQMTNNCMTEGTLDLALPPTSTPVAVSAQDQNGAVISSVSVSPISSGSPTIWGSFTWGSAVWGGGVAAALAPYELQWNLPVVFSRMTLMATGNSIGGLRLGTLHARYQILRTLTNIQAAA